MENKIHSVVEIRELSLVIDRMVRHAVIGTILIWLESKTHIIQNITISLIGDGVTSILGLLWVFVLIVLLFIGAGTLIAIIQSAIYILIWLLSLISMSDCAACDQEFKSHKATASLNVAGTWDMHCPHCGAYIGTTRPIEYLLHSMK